MATRTSSNSRPPGYLLELLRKGGDSTLYRGRERGNPSPVLAVAPAAEQPFVQGLRRPEHEYSLAAELDPAWAARPLALTRHEGRTILTLEDPGGEPLDRVLERDQGRRLDLTRFLRIAIGLTKALGQVHRRGLIHKDIKPENVLVDDAGNVWLTGFGIASQLPNERQAPAPPEMIAGTLAYMAPEQTGRMNRSMDTRSDLYSLGVTLYQMLTGRLPFAAADAMEWIHCHIARQPTPPDRIGKFPTPLSAIIMRLLAKTVEERYQTAVGLEADLRRCLAEWEMEGHIDLFPLGMHDVPDRLLIPEKLYGREHEVNGLLRAFDRVVAQGTPELVLVSGYSGVGKSSVVNELHKVLVPPRGLFASSKFDQYKRDIADMIANQQRFIATMQGRTATFSTFSDEHFDEAAFEALSTADRMPIMVYFYWILKLQAQFLAGDHAEALVSADKAKALLWASAVQIQLLDYFYYGALTVAASYENGSADEQQAWRELLRAHQEQLREWAENNPPTFADKLALVSAEIARIEKRDTDAMHLYEQAIQSAREHGFVQNEALSYEVAARFYLARGLETVAYAYLRNARNCYERWGALSKVKQLDECYPQLHEERNPISPIATIGSSVGQLDVETVVKASQALSSEIVLPKLIEKLLRIAVEHAGAERGLLIFLRGDEPQIEAEATTAHGSVEVTVRQAPVTPSDLPQSALHYVIRTRERVVLDDASVGTLYAEDEYVRQKHARSILCLPIIKQTKLAGALYLENNLTPRAFTAERVAVLELMASQAAIALENASLYSDLQTSEGFLAQGQSLSHTGSFGLNAWNGEIYWSDETYKIFEFDRAAKPTLDWVLQRTHPEDRYLLQETLDRSLAIEMDFDFEHRLLMPDGAIKHVHALARVVKTSSGKRGFVGTVTDITEHKRTEEALRRSERYLAEAQRLAHMGSWVWRVTGREAVYLSEEWYRIYGFDPEAGAPAWSERLQRVHPEDRAKWHETIDRAIDEKSDYEVEFRILLPDGTVKSIYTVGHPVMNACAEVTEFVGSSADITERKRAEEKIRQSERELRQVLDLSPQHIAEFGPDRDSTRLYINQAALDYFGSTLEEWRSGDRRRFFHPDDWARWGSEAQGNFLSGSPYEFETRLRRRDGQYRWFLFRHNPLRDEQGRVTRWYVAATDIEDRKQAEQRLQHENVALREELDKASMFEEIVGMSPRLQTVLSRVSKVAPTDSGVLITGETGTGKELVARAIHRRSRRASRAFVSVNCAAIPRDLIASELFGHEKGSFTGATQRRIGRFELAEGGTIFLDEVGELPAETQIALLRVLQEREFERVGGTGSIQIDVRVIAATNRDLEAAIAAGMFRSDLFYRLNVFPIEMPSLRERREDIPLLVEYFIGRYARKAGKSFQTVNKRSFDLLQSYPWPGNIRELQNVIERSVIVCDTDNFSVDESWLSRKPIASGPTSQLELSQTLAAQEKQLIEAALRESGGRVSGPSGAATKLRMPGSTLESKIKSLNINKTLFKTVDHSTSRI